MRPPARNVRADRRGSLEIGSRKHKRYLHPLHPWRGGCDSTLPAQVYKAGRRFAVDEGSGEIDITVPLVAHLNHALESERAVALACAGVDVLVLVLNTDVRWLIERRYRLAYQSHVDVAGKFPHSKPLVEGHLHRPNRQRPHE